MRTLWGQSTNQTTNVVAPLCLIFFDHYMPEKKVASLHFAREFGTRGKVEITIFGRGGGGKFRR